jgi:hypothetical protein
MSLASRLVLEAEIETATRLEQLLTRDHRQTATPRGDHSMAFGSFTNCRGRFWSSQDTGRRKETVGIGSFTTGVVDLRAVKIREKLSE